MVNQAFITTTAEEPIGSGPWKYLLDGLDLPIQNIVSRWDVDTIDSARYPTFPYLGTWFDTMNSRTLSCAAALISGYNDHKQARFDGVKDYVAGSIEGLGVRSVGILARKVNASTSAAPLSFGAAYLTYNSNGSIGVVGESSPQYLNPSTSLANWHWIWLSFDGTKREVSINGGTPGVSSSTKQFLTKIEIGRTQDGGSYGGNPLLVSSIVCLNTPVTQTQRQNVWNAFAAARPSWVSQ